MAAEDRDTGLATADPAAEPDGEEKPHWSEEKVLGPFTKPQLLGGGFGVALVLFGVVGLLT